MRFGIFRRRVVVIAAGLVAGSALAAGVPSLVLHNPHSSAAAATATITLSTSQFGALTFAHLGGITNDEQDQQSCSSGTCTYTPTAVPPTITLTEPFATGMAIYQDMMSWEGLIREGNPTGRMDATLTLTSTTGATIAAYVLENAWPTNVDVPAGGPQTVSFTVTLTGDLLVLSSS
jgi:hypothetical protein